MTPYGDWEYGVNGASRRPWFVFRTRDSGNAPMQVLCDRGGRYRRFGSANAARKAANTANRSHEEPRT